LKSSHPARALPWRGALGPTADLERTSNPHLANKRVKQDREVI
jgi:hypothetical protein